MSKQFSISLLLMLAIFSRYTLSAEENCGQESYQVGISGKIYEISDFGIKTPFRGRLDLEDTGLYANVSDGSFELSDPVKVGKNICSGSRVKFKLDDPDLFILSPFAGEFYLPRTQANNKSDEFQVRVVRKYSRFYQTLALSNESYAVQVVVTSNEGGAIDVINKLNSSAVLNSTDYFAYYEPHMRGGMPNNGYIYKVKVGTFLDKDGAEKIRDQLINLGREFSKSFVTANVRFYQ